MNEKNKKCPFLKEEKIIYCKNFPLKKITLSKNVFEAEDRCFRKEHKECPLYTKGTIVLQKEMTICPFVTYEIASLCIAYPFREGVGNAAIALCTSSDYHECEIYRRTAAEEREERILNVHGFLFDETKDYVEGHYWLKRKNGLIRIGIDDFAQFILGELRGIRLRKTGDTVKKNEWLVRCETTDGEVELYAPFSGLVDRTNENLIKSPSMVNQDPYGNGWFCEMKAEDIPKTWQPSEAKILMAIDIGRLEELLKEKAGFAMADGGEFVRDIRPLLKEKAMVLIHEFLKGKEV